MVLLKWEVQWTALLSRIINTFYIMTTYCDMWIPPLFVDRFQVKYPLLLSQVVCKYKLHETILMIICSISALILFYFLFQVYSHLLLFATVTSFKKLLLRSSSPRYQECRSFIVVDELNTIFAGKWSNLKSTFTSFWVLLSYFSLFSFLISLTP